MVKRAVFGLSSLAILAAPVATLVSCTSAADLPPVIFTGNLNNLYGTAMVGPRNDNSYNSQTNAVISAFSGRANNFIATSTIDTIDSIKPQYQTAAAAGAEVIVAAGFRHKEAIESFRLDGLTNYFVALDTQQVVSANGSADPRVITINFKSEQAGFLAGYVTAAQLSINAQAPNASADAKDPVVLAYGGLNLGTVTPFMAGFQQGVTYFNATTTPATLVRFLSMPSLQDYFVNTFDPSPPNFEIMLNTWLNARGVDAIFPVAGGQHVTVARLLNNNYKNLQKYVVGVDVNLAGLLPEASDKIITSALKNIAFTETAVLNELYKLNNPVPAPYSTTGDLAIGRAFFNSKITNNDPLTLFGQQFIGGVAEGFVGLSNLAALRTSLNISDGAYSALLAAALAATVDFVPPLGSSR